jgi:hypothetical protein
VKEEMIASDSPEMLDERQAVFPLRPVLLFSCAFARKANVSRKGAKLRLKAQRRAGQLCL